MSDDAKRRRGRVLYVNGERTPWRPGAAACTSAARRQVRVRARRKNRLHLYRLDALRSRARGHARAASSGLRTHGILPTKSTTAAAAPCPYFAALAAARTAPFLPRRLHRVADDRAWLHDRTVGRACARRARDRAYRAHRRSRARSRCGPGFATVKRLERATIPGPRTGGAGASL